MRYKHQTVIQSCSKLLWDYVDKNHINVANLDKTVLWKKIHEFSSEWNPQCIEYGRFQDSQNMHLLTEITKEEMIKEHIREMLQKRKEQ